jgi:hypothetical protein
MCKKPIKVGEKIKMQWFYGWSGSELGWDKKHLDCFIKSIKNSSLDWKRKTDLLRQIEEWDGKGMKII